MSRAGFRFAKRVAPSTSSSEEEEASSGEEYSDDERLQIQETHAIASDVLSEVLALKRALLVIAKKLGVEQEIKEALESDSEAEEGEAEESQEPGSEK